VYSSRLVIW